MNEATFKFEDLYSTIPQSHFIYVLYTIVIFLGIVGAIGGMRTVNTAPPWLIISMFACATPAILVALAWPLGLLTPTAPDYEKRSIIERAMPGFKVSHSDFKILTDSDQSGPIFLHRREYMFVLSQGTYTVVRVAPK